jgi:superfamily II DNA or RNA helicase
MAIAPKLAMVLRNLMKAVELTDELFGKIAGWDVVKNARAVVAGDRVLSSDWAPPVLKGIVQEGPTSYRAGLVIKDAIDVENLCTCRASKQWGSICVHSVAVGLHYLQRLKGPPPAPTTKAPQPPAKPQKPAKAIRRSAAGEKLEIHVVLPPNFKEALARGKVMLVLEGDWEKGRVPLDRAPLDVEFALSSEDVALLDAAEKVAGGDTPGMLMISADQFAEMLPKMAGHPRITIGKTQKVEVSNELFPMRMQATLQSNGEIRLHVNGAAPANAFGKATKWVFENNRFIHLPAMMEIGAGGKTITRLEVPAFLSRDWPALAASGATANFKLEDFSLQPLEPKIRLMLTGGLAHLQGQLHFVYGEQVIRHGTADANSSVWLPDAANPTRYSTRDFAAEQAAVARLTRNGFTGPHAEGIFQLAGQNAVLAFFARDYQKLIREWDVKLEERLEKSTKQNLEVVTPKFQITPSGEQWFDLSVNYTTSGGLERFSAADIQRLLLSGQSHTRLKNGKFALIDTGAVEELQEVLLDCAPQQNERGYRMSNAQAGFFRSALKEQPSWEVRAPQSWTTRAQRQSGEMKVEAPPLGNLAEVLRPYQEHGVGWLHFLRQNRFGGILADEMGLGKTLQTLAYLWTVKNSAEPLKGGTTCARPSLIVCPTSLVFNWANEAARFTPELKVVRLHGPKRQELFAEIPNADLVITSYGLIRRDAELYCGIEFDTVVLDEAQHIKNRQTQNAQAVKAIRSQHRLVLTGTPLENSVLDLWSIFDFLMPGYLGSSKDFKERYEIPIAREKSVEAQARLARRIRPFLLRRLKTEVAKDLPAKIEQVSYCELTPAQQSIYEQILDAGRKEITSAVEANGLQKSRMLILNALLRLRQICCDLRLLKLENVDPANASGKTDLFRELLEEVVDGGHRVLVFSQFVSMLTLLKEHLASEQIEYCYLDGSTTDRAGVVEKFQKTSIPVFLISLKAGGVGLNLTGADTVIHFDPWWNPAVEDQATDRAHRIGQSKVVTSYKLITRGTVEEKILNLQERKRAVIAATLSSEEAFTEALTWEEIQGLFA